jgi:hypothetical protein
MGQLAASPSLEHFLIGEAMYLISAMCKQKNAKCPATEGFSAASKILSGKPVVKPKVGNRSWVKISGVYAGGSGFKQA